jgi:hypothetical protein
MNLIFSLPTIIVLPQFSIFAKNREGITNFRFLTGINNNGEETGHRFTVGTVATPNPIE